jgi:hypothetical protein
VQELGLPELSAEQMEQLCILAEKAAREYILSKISNKDASILDVITEAEGAKSLNLHVEINLALSPNATRVDSTAIVNEAVKEAFKAAETFLRKLV